MDLAKSNLAKSSPELGHVLAAFARDVLDGAALPSLAIHPGDLMLRYLLDHRHGDVETAVFDYFRSGWSAWRTFRALLQWHFGEALATIAVLDFASGFGRVSRHALADLGARLTVSDIFPQAMTFQAEALGLRTLASAHAPSALALPREYDAVLAASFFSHLPADSFGDWLRALLAALRPGGVLVFSTHADESGAPDLRFDTRSEIPELPGQEYGTSWASEAFVRRCVAEVAPGAACAHFPRALWSLQDVYVVAPDRPLDAAPPRVAEPLGFLERTERSADGRRLLLSGWAHDPLGEPVEAEVRVGSVLRAVAPTNLQRPDVAAALDSPRAARSGWRAEIEEDLPRLAGATFSVILRTRDGRTFPLHVGSVEGSHLFAHGRAVEAQLAAEIELRIAFEREVARLEPALAERQRRVEDLQTEIATMRASRFWKARDAWWGLKQRIRPKR